MYYWELSQQIFRDMRAHKVRSVLALFGIVWGTVGVVLLLALGEGFYLAGKKNMGSLANGAIHAWISTTSKPYQGQAPGQKIHLRASQVMQMAKVLPEIQYI